MKLKTTEKATQTKLKGINVHVQRLPEGTTDTVLYFLTTCTALRHFGILKYLLMSVIIEKRVSREPRH